MSALEGLGVVLVMLVVLGATWMSYVALWHMQKDFRRQWRKLSHERRRTVAIGMTLTALLSAVGVTLVIVQPWGARTFLRIFGSLGVVAVIGSLIGATGAASREIRQARGRRNPND
jgi:putative Mn2+ efflux pump MntP